MGPPVIELDGVAVHVETRKTTALLAYLSVNQQSIPREVLANLFWPNFDQKHAQANLRRSLFSLNNSIKKEILIPGGGSIGINELVSTWMDVHEFQRQISSAQSHANADLPACEDCLELLDKAAGLCRGEFLAGLNLPDCPEFDEWQYFQREGLKQELTRCLEQLAKGYASQSKWEIAIGYARRWVSSDRLNEPAHRSLMSLYYQSGQRSAAIRQYKSLTQLLQEEFGQSPEPETVQLYEQVQAHPFEKHLHPTVPFAQENEPLIKTKMLIPPLRVERIPRLRLLELLDAGCQRSLTLISAPAGFGKTTLLAHWTTNTQLPVAWFSLDEGDNDPIRFLSYLIAAVDSVLPGFAEQFQGAFQLLQPTVQPILIGLINHLASVSEPFVLILDDYHFIHSPDVHRNLAFLVEKIPACMHVILATRVDPPLPLARLRARDQLIEIRANDLRFTTEESTDFLKQVMSLDLTNEDVSALNVRTEGWIAGLQMAALALRSIIRPQLPPVSGSDNIQKDIAGFIQVFSGSNRYILDYLGEEVLNSLPGEIKRFLLQTSILERLSGPLCDAVTGTSVSLSILKELEKRNLFLIPLDEERCWYRYHHLFQELLRYQTEEVHLISPGQDGEIGFELGDLHLRAANWFEQQNLMNEAVQHFLAARQFDRVAGLIEAQGDTMLFTIGQTYTLFEWITALPAEQFRLRPRLSVLQAWALFAQNQFASGQEALETAWQVVKDRQDQQSTSLCGEIALARGVLSELSNRDVVVMREQALLAWEKIPPDHLMLRGLAAWLLGSSYYFDGDPLNAEKYFSQAVHLCRQASNIYFTLVSIGDLTNVQRELGRYREAFHLLLKTEQEMSAGDQPHPMLGHLYIASSQILLQWNDLAASEQHLKLGLDLVAQGIPGEILIFGLSALPYLRLAQGKPGEAQRLAQECLDKLESYPLPYLPQQVRASLVRFWLRVGRIDRIQEWLINCNVSPEDTITYIYEAKYFALAKILLWQGRSDEALKLLERLAEYSQARSRNGKLSYILELQALAFQQQNNQDAALAALERSLKLAQSEGYIRAYVDEGLQMQALLELGTEQGRWSGAYLDSFVNQLLVAIRHDQALRSSTPEPGKSKSGQLLSTGLHSTEWIEELSDREVEVLRLAADGLTNQQIGKALFLSAGTIKSHLHHIYGKLGVQGRVQAIALANEQHLL